MKKIILKCSLAVGDTVMLTSAVRDLHLSYPGRFVTDVRTPFPELWENNPNLTTLDEANPDVETIECHFPLIARSNETPHHVVHGFIQFLSAKLSLNIRASSFKGDIHIAAEEKQWVPQVEEITGQFLPYWIVVAGGKYDITIKWWDSKRYQEVVDFFQGKILFVQVGLPQHHHPPLGGVIDLRGKTTLRQLIRLIYHAQGVICPVTALMHLAAAIETKPGMPKNRACVVIAGGREPFQWEAYPHHQFIHTNGALLCCDNGGCWKSRTVALGDGDERDETTHLCVDVQGGLPRCMAMISASDVIRRVGLFFEGGALRFLTPSEQMAARHGVRTGQQCKWDKESLESLAFRRASEEFIMGIGGNTSRFTGRGIIICAGGIKYLTCAWICVNMLRKHGCNLPVELWHLNQDELHSEICSLLATCGVEFVNAEQMRDIRPARILGPWPLKAYALLHCRFRQVLLLDADNVPIRNPEYLFTCPQFQATGAVFWPDFGYLNAQRAIWKVCGVRYRKEPEFESGQILVDKTKCLKPLSLALWYNEHADFYYQHVHGDKELFHMAFRKLGYKYAMPSTPIHALRGVMCQHDFEGRRVFQHRNLCKWTLNRDDPKIPGFIEEPECYEFLDKLRKHLSVQSSPDVGNAGQPQQLYHLGHLDGHAITTG